VSRKLDVGPLVEILDGPDWLVPAGPSAPDDPNDDEEEAT
jgi:hypothetical protein